MAKKIKKKKFFVTTPVYYVNDKPHIGHAYTTVAADVLARARRAQEESALLLTGTDEHGLKIQHRAEASGKDPQKFVDEISIAFRNLWDRLQIRYDKFIRTTEAGHKGAVQKVLQALFETGAIYKGEYEGYYCVGCEQFKSESELDADRLCPDHFMRAEKVKEECYLLKLSSLQNEIMRKIESDEFAIEPAHYRKEILSFLKLEKLKDVSISRKNVSWGIPLPFDPQHTTYVWFDAFLSYLTGLGWKGDRISMMEIESTWPPDVQLIGKDILRVHATIWPAMLMHLEIPLPRKLYVHGHILSGGRKMSKTIGNVISVDLMLDKFGADGTRYLLMSAGTFGEDVDLAMERVIEKYNADLANGIGNLISRVLKLAKTSKNNSQALSESKKNKAQISEAIGKLQLDRALEIIWRIIRDDNKYIEDTKPWELAKNNEEKFSEVMDKLMSDLALIAKFIAPFMPQTAEKIKRALETKEMEILFPRIK